MERKQHDGYRADLLSATAAVLLVCAAAWDVFRTGAGTASPQVSYVLVAVAIVAGCTAVLGRVFANRPRRTFPSVDPARPASPSQKISEPPRRWRRNLVELMVLGLLLLGWWIRGDPGIPADPPVIAVELVGALVLGATSARAWRSARRARNQP